MKPKTGHAHDESRINELLRVATWPGPGVPTRLPEMDQIESENAPAQPQKITSTNSGEHVGSAAPPTPQPASPSSTWTNLSEQHGRIFALPTLQQLLSLQSIPEQNPYAVRKLANASCPETRPEPVSALPPLEPTLRQDPYAIAEPASVSIPEIRSEQDLYAIRESTSGPIPDPRPEQASAPLHACHHHHHSHGSHDTSQTAVDGCQAHRNGALESRGSHSHAQSSGICCSESPRSSEESSLKHLGERTRESEDRDLERGPPSFERVILRIVGLKCGCCEGGISRVIRRIAAIKNHQVNIVLARVEFDLDTNRLSVADVIQRLSVKTGYTYEAQVQSVGQVLEVIAADPTQLKEAKQPNGVVRIDIPKADTWHPLKLLSGRNSAIPMEAPHSYNNVDGAQAGPLAPDTNSDTAGCAMPQICQQPAQIYYDPTKLGARDIFEYYKKFDPKLHLAPPAAHPSLAVGANQTKRALYLFLPTFALTIPVAVLAWAPIDHGRLEYAHVSLVLATVVQIIALTEFLPNAIRSLYHSRVFEMDFLIAFSTTTAYIFSVVSYGFQIKGEPLETGSFFEASTLLVTLILLGRVINEFARFRAAKSVSFRSLQIDKAELVLHSWQTGTTVKRIEIDARLLQYNDVFMILPHTRVVTDGIVLYGGSEIDESMITGESVPVAKGVHSAVFAGTNNGSGVLIVRLTALPHENSVHRIAAMVENAELTKPKIQALADQIAGWFVPVIATIGLLVFLAWIFVDRYHYKHSLRNSVVTAITYAIATLIVSCPCAIGLAVPMVILIASGVAARFGIIFRDPQKLEIARNVTDIVFDKTGTLTCGVPTVVHEDYHGTDERRAREILLGLLKDIKHPVSASVLRHLERDMQMNPEKSIIPRYITDIRSIPGEGVMGTEAITSHQVLAGSPDWLHIRDEHVASTTFCVKINGILSATYHLLDRPRHTAELVVSKLQARGITVHMISGDAQGAVDDTAHTLNILKRNTKARCKPEGKCTYVKDLQDHGVHAGRKRIVMFVGDGTNDAVALKQADVGVHITTTTTTQQQSSSSSSPTSTSTPSSDVAKSAADIILTTTRLHSLLILLDISHSTYRRILLNFAWSALYNVGAVLLAAGAFVPLRAQLRIQPQWAGLGELVSVLPVVAVAFSVGCRRYAGKYREIEYDYLRCEREARGGGR